MVDQQSKIDVVVVEDNEDEARLTLLGLGRIQPKPSVVVIPDGSQALVKLTGEVRLTPQVVLLDLKLPLVHGLDILAAIKSNEASCKTPVLIFTSSDHPMDVSRAADLGCSEYLCKPIQWEDYIKIVCTKTADYLEASRCGDQL